MNFRTALLPTFFALLVHNALAIAPNATWPEMLTHLKTTASNPTLVLLSTSPRFARNTTTTMCLCSPSAAGHPPLTDPAAVALTALFRDLSREKRGSLRRPTILKKIQRQIVSIAMRYGLEGYANLDAKLRSIVPQTHCYYDRVTGMNLIPIITDDTPRPYVAVSARGCDKVTGFQAAVMKATPAQKKLLVPSPGPKGAEGDVSARRLPDAIEIARKREGVKNPGPLPPTMAELGAPSLPPVPSMGIPTPSMELPVPSPAPSASPSASPSALPSSSAVASPSPAPVNEGCVAVEHLASASLQHTEHLRRSTLCARGFCATPNHAIVVEGRWTSMKAMCEGEWECTKEVKLVNNLKLAVNRRWRFDESIVITPYDARFPRAAVWAVQMAEDVFALLAAAIAAGVLAGAGVLAASWASAEVADLPPVQMAVDGVPARMWGACAPAAHRMSLSQPLVSAAS